MLKKSMVVMAVIGIITACMCGCMSSPEQSSIVKFHPDIQPYHTTHYTTLTNKIYINMNDPLIKEKNNYMTKVVGL
ncbi:hypothetical protein [Methanothermococcus okinawensis]|uniref:Lipoprotein n=1 Tax=Methanothermococcus okinawensis (strain DSM 14208 / JCM 11175 / IH1) TaxID=647113 RepID=F8ANT3_METOI|nr:hypothetical protein [Methanothermococcus okinawensis]AEH06284.1 hypothetical protein Metok_0294 [Methanothermococcus okinawensis IH1]